MQSNARKNGVISPILANMFMHYVFDKWLGRQFPESPFERFADDGIVHCRKEEARGILKELEGRMKTCKLELHPEKTRIVYCKDKDRTKEYQETGFDFLGYTFKGVFIKYRDGGMGINYIASASKKSHKAFRDKIRALEIHKKTGCKYRDDSGKHKPDSQGMDKLLWKIQPSGNQVLIRLRGQADNKMGDVQI